MTKIDNGFRAIARVVIFDRETVNVPIYSTFYCSNYFPCLHLIRNAFLHLVLNHTIHLSALT